MGDDNENEKTRIEKMADHMAILNEEMGGVQVDVAVIKTDMAWVKKLALWQLGLLGSLLLGSVGYIIFG